MADIAKYVEDVAKYTDSVNEEAVAAIVKSLAPVLGNRDAMYVSCGDDSEMETVRKNFMEKKCGVEAGSDKAKAASEAVCEKMKDAHMKNRVTFYYLSAEQLGCLGDLA